MAWPHAAQPSLPGRRTVLLFARFGARSEAKGPGRPVGSPASSWVEGGSEDGLIRDNPNVEMKVKLRHRCRASQVSPRPRGSSVMSSA